MSTRKPRRPRGTLTVEYEYNLEEENVSVRGNAMTSGDPRVDRETEDWILSELRRGNTAAWAMAHVHATLRFVHGDLRSRDGADGYIGHGDAYLDQNSYESEEALWESVTLEYNLEGDARMDAAKNLRGQISLGGAANLFESLLVELEYSENFKHLMAQQQRALRMMATNPEWASGELVHIDAALERL